MNTNELLEIGIKFPYTMWAFTFPIGGWSSIKKGLPIGENSNVEALSDIYKPEVKE